MNARIFLLTLGLLGLVVTPGCCLLHGCGGGCGCGCGYGLFGCIGKIRDRIHNCSHCHKRDCGGDCGCSCGGMMYGDMGMSDCGCGAPSAAGCGCGIGGGHVDQPAFMTPPMTVPTPQAAPPVPSSNVTMPPPIPPADSSSTTPVPQGTQQVSVEEFQRLPGVIISGPGAQPLAVPTTSTMVQSPTPVPANVAAPAPTAKPIQQASGATAPTITPSATRQVQQTGWAPVRQ